MPDVAQLASNLFHSNQNTRIAIHSYTWDGENQLKTAAGITYSYDAP
jgi:hypothetical protein